MAEIAYACNNEGQQWGATMRGNNERQQWGATMRGNNEGQQWGATMRGNNVGQQWEATMRGNNEGQQWGETSTSLMLIRTYHTGPDFALTVSKAMWEEFLDSHFGLIWWVINIVKDILTIATCTNTTRHEYGVIQNKIMKTRTHTHTHSLSLPLTQPHAPYICYLLLQFWLQELVTALAPVTLHILLEDHRGQLQIVTWYRECDHTPTKPHPNGKATLL